MSQASAEQRARHTHLRPFSHIISHTCPLDAGKYEQAKNNTSGMQIRVFSIGVMSTLDEQEEINRFLRGHRVLAIDKHYDDCRGLWTFAVTYIDGNMPSSGKVSSSEKARLFHLPSNGS